MAEKQDASNKEDFLELWKRALAAQEQQWSSLFDRASSGDAAAGQFAKVLENYLQLTRVSREQVEQYLQASNLPTRGDIATLAKRIDDLSNRIEELSREIHARNAKPAQKKKAKPPGGPAKDKTH